MKTLSVRKVFKNTLGLLIAAMIYCLLVACVNAAESEPIKVYVEELPVEFTISPALQDGTTLVQLRPLFEALDIELTWNNDTRTVIGEKGNKTFTLPIGQSTATVNGESVQLLLPAKIEGEGHTMVPLRFVGEATGAAVGWHGKTQTISVYSSEYLQITGLSHKEAEALANSGLQSKGDVSENELRGFYTRGYADLLGTYGCRGMCWDYYIFINDHQLLTRPPEQDWNQITCLEIECLSYEIKDGHLIINGDKQFAFERLPDGDIKVRGNRFTKHEPLKRHRLNGKYDAVSFVSGLSGGGFASTSTFIFKPNGTFLDDSSFSLMTDGSEFGDGSGVSSTIISETESAGRYAIINHSILLEYNDGTTETFVFFRPDLNDNMLKISGRDFLIDRNFDPDAPIVVSPDESGTTTENEVLPSNEPYEDLLTTEGIAEKLIVEHVLLEEIDSLHGVFITLDGYQWAELNIPTDQRGKFTGFGDGTIVSFTVKYTVDNYTGKEIDLTTLEATIWNQVGSVTENTELAPSTLDQLADGEIVQRLAVFLFPKDVIEEFGSFDLVFSGLKTSEGEALFGDLDIEFRMDHPFN